MDADPISTSVRPDDEGCVPCWCCDTVGPSGRTVRLGNHPEVHLCLSCAHYVHQQAWEIEDAGKRGPAAFARGRMRTLRAAVIRRGWHDHRFVGGALRWLGRHVP